MMSDLNLTPPSDIEALIVGALGNILAHRRIVENARIVVTVRGLISTDDGAVQVIDIAIIPKHNRKYWYSPRHDAKFASWLITWRVKIGNLVDLSLEDIAAIADGVDRHIGEDMYR